MMEESNETLDLTSSIFNQCKYMATMDEGALASWRILIKDLSQKVQEALVSCQGQVETLEIQLPATCNLPAQPPRDIPISLMSTECHDVRFREKCYQLWNNRNQAYQKTWLKLVDEYRLIPSNTNHALLSKLRQEYRACAITNLQGYLYDRIMMECKVSLAEAKKNWRLYDRHRRLQETIVNHIATWRHLQTIWTKELIRAMKVCTIITSTNKLHKWKATFYFYNYISIAKSISGIDNAGNGTMLANRKRIY
jgi:hypothetical protein